MKVFGDQLGTLDTTARAITGALGGTQGIADLQFKPQSGTPTLALVLQPGALAASGLKVQDVLEAVQTNYAGTIVGQTFSGTRSVDVKLLLPRSGTQPARTPVIADDRRSFRSVPLSQVARLMPTETRYAIQHDGGQRFVSITFNVTGRGLQATVDDAKARVTALKLPPGVYVEFSGAAAEQRASEAQFLLYTGFALVLIGMILFISFQWRSNTCWCW